MVTNITNTSATTSSTANISIYDSSSIYALYLSAEVVTPETWEFFPLQQGGEILRDCANQPISVYDPTFHYTQTIVATFSGGYEKGTNWTNLKKAIMYWLYHKEVLTLLHDDVDGNNLAQLPDFALTMSAITGKIIKVSILERTADHARVQFTFRRYVI